ncbi:MAG: DNA polymerase I [Candidatus Riflebacteria bacterium]|nr:DNA polymerase I [Candidatus Riflebacteria bacterium]
MAKCLLIDGNNIVFRAYYAFQNQRLKTSAGLQTGALFGFIRMITKVLKERSPKLVAVAFDTTSNTFRKKLYPLYKAKRKPVPEDLLLQLPLAHKATEALGIKIMTNDNFEADDLIGSAAKKLAEKYDVEIITGDRDLLQLIDDKITVELCQKGVSETKPINTEVFYEEYKFMPKGIIELKALMGDTSDNIPGVKGIGEKKGLALVQEYGNIDNLYASLDKIDNVKTRQMLVNDKEMAYLSHKLATIVVDVDTFEDENSLIWNEKNLNNAQFINFLQSYEFSSLLKEFSQKNFSEDSPQEISQETAVQKENQKLPGEKLLINNIEDFIKYWDTIGNEVCLDIETDGLNPVSDRIIGISFAANEEKAVYVPLKHSYLGLTQEDQMNSEAFFEFLKNNIKNKRIVGHNLKFDLAFLKSAGVEVSDNIFDTLIAAYLEDPSRSNALKSLGKNLLGYEVTEYRQVAKDNDFASVEIDTAKDYACQDTLLTMRLYPIMTKQLEEKNLLHLFNSLETPVVKILMEMEYIGIGLNSKYLSELSIELQNRLEESEKIIHTLAGHEFNLNSPKQLQEVLFNELKLTPPKKNKTGYSTDIEVLKILQFEHAICKELMEYRELAKLKNTYADSLISLVNPITKKIHANFNQAVTATGRLSGSNPNLQNIPVKTELGRKIRRSFIPPRAGDKFLSIDYSQIELRLLAHFSKDPELIKAYINNIDIHSLTAAKIFTKDPEHISGSERSVGKTVNFGILYGISAHGLSEDLGITRIMAKEYIDSFYNGFSEVNGFFEKILENAREVGQVETLLGRIRQIPDINASKVLLKNAAERMAKNTVLQGSAADLVKKAMIDTTVWLKENNFQTKLVLQIHDELVFTVPEIELEIVTQKLKSIMENCVSLNIPLVCDIAIGDNLADLA